MRLKIITPDKLILDQEVDSVTLPGELGEMTILPHHAQMLAVLKSGFFYYRARSQKSEPQLLKGGFVEVRNKTNEVLVLTPGV